MQDEGTHPILRTIRKLAAAGQIGRVTDGQLLKRYATERDEAAFEILVHRHGAMVWHVCRNVLRDAHAAEDAFQATFLILVRKAATIGKPELLGNWLYGVAYRVALRARKSLSRQQARERPGVEILAAAAADNPAGADCQPLLQEELQRLPTKYRFPMVLCYLEGRTNEEAARQLEWPVGTVKVRLMRGRQMLRTRLVRRGLTLSAGAAVSFMFQNTASAVPAPLVDATLRAALFLAAGKPTWLGACSAHAVALAEGVLKTMWWTKMKIVATMLVTLALLGTSAGLLALRTLAGDQNDGGQGAAAGPKPAREALQDQGPSLTPKSLKPAELTPEALAAHLGIHHTSFELVFDKPPNRLNFAIEVYKNGKKTFVAPDTAEFYGRESKTQRCSVMFSRKQGDGEMFITLKCPDGTTSLAIEYPFSIDVGIFMQSLPPLDAEGRIVLAAKYNPIDGVVKPANRTLDKATEALVLRVTAK